MMMNVIELRQNRWIPRKGVDQGPKKITEIHNEIKREQMENQMQRDQGDNSLGANRKTWHQGAGGGTITTETTKVAGKKALEMKPTKELQRCYRRKSCIVGSSKDDLFWKTRVYGETDSEEVKAALEEKYQKIGKEVGAILESYDEGDLNIHECVQEIFEIASSEKFGCPNINEIFFDLRNMLSKSFSVQLSTIERTYNQETRSHRKRKPPFYERQLSTITAKITKEG
ncbi:unnamed protein product [Cylicocyclus nassatus]|uniref:Uncharacterized protein n=1 Tax=Cylicocyclus nassatus TaxID=53992 RepID=A0AA36DMW4_CYLNA|nr:unnamed protein product [Cylicocyclus nassatus]